MDLHIIEERILFLSPFVKEVVVVIHDGYPFALIYPDFEALKTAHIINIESEIRWYAVELYNMEVKESQKVRGYKIYLEPLPKTKSKEFDIAVIKEQINNNKESNTTIEEEPDSDLYKALKSYIFALSGTTVLPSSHIELDLGLDSLNYVELFIFIEKSFGVYIDEVIFSKIMTVQALYEYVRQHQRHFNPTKIKWKTILDEHISQKLIYSPFIIFAYKILLWPLFKLYFRFEIKGQEHIPSSSCIIAPSHQSMIDGFLMVASLPYNILKQSFFLAFKGVFGTTLINPFAKYGQTILIDSNHNLKNSMQRTALPLKAGKNVVIFPEGARTRDRKLLEFRPFFAMLSKTYKVPIVPVVIDGSFEALRAGMLFPRPKKIRITFLKPINSDELSYDEITVLVKEAIESEIKRNPISL
ncbi:MAG: 1-acyl-sn-glycerol-3-phosphate acyltransferase [Arcobacteraceae bacterium]|nr:1-acyl-sn-glycerol-3-phosphate acyltransferase [Arcobacteraceae bacterium]